MDVVVRPHRGVEIDVSGFGAGTRLSCGSCDGEFEVPGRPAAPPPPPRRSPGTRGGAGSRRLADRGARSRRGRAGDRARGRGRREHVPDLLLPAILAMIFCCLLGGIVSIVYAAQANGYRPSGNWGAAVRAANNAKGWVIAGALLARGVARNLPWYPFTLLAPA